jgi:lysophospholipase L1-like esterase
MNKLFAYPAVLILLVLSAFAIDKQENINVVFIGDSITHGTMRKDQSPVIYAGDYLVNAKLFNKVQVSNQGVSGFTTVDFLPVTHKAYSKVKAAADEFYKDSTALLVFSIMLGTNDSAIKGPTGSPVSPADYRENLATIADSLLAAYPRSKIVINYPVWYSNNTHNRGASYMQEGQLRLKSYWPEIDAVVKAFKKSRPHQVFKGDRKAYNYFEKNYLTNLKAENGLDGIFYLHPNKAGDLALGQFWAKAIINAVK